MNNTFNNTSDISFNTSPFNTRLIKIISVSVWCVALIQVALLLLGVIDANTDNSRLIIHAVESATIIGLIVASWLIRSQLAQRSDQPLHQQLGWLCFFSILICFGGDVVNYNLPQTFYRHGDVIKHDYLADSVFFFAPGYALLLLAVTKLVLARGLSARFMLISFLISSSIALASFFSMHLPGTGQYVSLITGSYSVLITAVGLSGIWLLHSYGWRAAPVSIWLVAAGLLLAALADGIIGTFWIYGNNGEGFFPISRIVNWLIYVTSQCLVIQLPWVSYAAQGRHAS